MSQKLTPWLWKQHFAENFKFGSGSEGVIEIHELASLQTLDRYSFAKGPDSGDIGTI